MPNPSSSSGGAGISPFPHGFGIICISQWAETGWESGGIILMCWLSFWSADYGTEQAGLLSCGGIARGLHPDRAANRGRATKTLECQRPWKSDCHQNGGGNDHHFSSGLHFLGFFSVPVRCIGRWRSFPACCIPPNPAHVCLCSLTVFTSLALDCPCWFWPPHTRCNAGVGSGI